jgi:hypothetical protein
MEYTSLFEPMIIIFISLLAGIILGSLSMIYIESRELKETKEELDKFRDLYFEEVRVNSLIDSKTITGALAN